MSNYSGQRWDSLILLLIILVLAGSKALVVLGLAIAGLIILLILKLIWCLLTWPFR